MIKKSIIENCFCSSKDYDGPDKQNAAQLPYPGCAEGVSAVARRPDFFRCDAQSFCYQPFAFRPAAVKGVGFLKLRDSLMVSQLGTVERDD